jgi:hypothetical protein
MGNFWSNTFIFSNNALKTIYNNHSAVSGSAYGMVSKFQWKHELKEVRTHDFLFVCLCNSHNCTKKEIHPWNTYQVGLLFSCLISFFFGLVFLGENCCKLIVAFMWWCYYIATIDVLANSSNCYSHWYYMPLNNINHININKEWPWMFQTTYSQLWL